MPCSVVVSECGYDEICTGFTAEFTFEVAEAFLRAGGGLAYAVHFPVVGIGVYGYGSCVGYISAARALASAGAVAGCYAGCGCDVPMAPIVTEGTTLVGLRVGFGAAFAGGGFCSIGGAGGVVVGGIGLEVVT